MVSTAEAFQSRAGTAGLTVRLIEDVVSAFYARIRVEPVLGPIFEDAIGSDWDAHIARIVSFWLSATRLRRGYEGKRFMPAHLQHGSIHAEQLPRWLSVFRDTVGELCSPAQAAVLIDIAERMAENIALGLTRRDSQIHPLDAEHRPIRPDRHATD